MRFFIFSVLILAFGFFVSPVEAQRPDMVSNLAKIRLLSEQETVQPGQEIWIGIEETIAPHWHTYWVNPGDSGLSLRIKWDLPEGVEISDIHWPLPKKIAYEPLLNYGYEDHVILLQKLKIPNNMPEGALSLEAKIEVLVCKEECIPEYGTYTLNLTVEESASDNNQNPLQDAVAKLPHKAGWSAQLTQEDQDFVLRIPKQSQRAQHIEFFPLDWGLIQNPATPDISYKGDTLIFKQARGDRSLEEINETSGLLVIEEDGERTGFSFTAQKQIAPIIAPEKPLTLSNDSGNITFLSALIFAILGGLILNLMPCVFPILSLKALSLVKISQKHPERARKHGLAYTFGVIISFLAIAALLISLKAAGAQIGWGFQLQNPFIVGLLSYLLFILGLNLSGFFEFSNSFGAIGGKLAHKDGLSGSFFTGILATLVATPCTAPFMAGALGFALVQPAVLGLLVFAALGLGLALPYLVLAFIPALHKILPKPGSWMEIFRQALAFPMFAAALWLLWVLGEQTGLSGLVSTLIGAVFITFALWLFQHRPTRPLRRIMVTLIALLSLGLAMCSIPQTTQSNISPSEFGETFSNEKLEVLLRGDDPIFVEMTAAWCITCKLNHAVAINTSATKELFKHQNIHYFIGDWTNEDPVITQYLSRYGRNGVPLYVYYAPRDSKTGQRPEAQILPQILTPNIIKKRLAQ